MFRIILGLALTVLALPAAADDRSYTVTSFDRVRVEGPFDVRLTVGNAGQSAKASGDADVLANLDVDVQGTTLIIRKGSGGWGERGKVGGPAPVITLVTSSLRTVTVIGGGKLTVGGAIRSQRFDVQVNGTGSIDARGIASDELYVTLIGAGNIAMAGKSARARLVTSGSGNVSTSGSAKTGSFSIQGSGDIDAAKLTLSQADVRVMGSGGLTATVAGPAKVDVMGSGDVTLTGGAKCTTSKMGSGSITCS